MAILPEGLEIRIGQKTYHGFRDKGDICFIEVLEPGEGIGHPLKHEVRHSPTGFEWGYGGSGPADTARSILADHLGFVPPAAVYQRFKFMVVSVWPRNDWSVTSDQVALVVEGIKQELGIDCLRCGDYGFTGDEDRTRGSRPCSCAIGQRHAADTFDPAEEGHP